jgi:REP element-mobilizing transposase RayT
MRNINFSEGEFYHIFNRGVDKRNIFKTSNDLARFIEGLSKFNTPDSIGNIDRGHSTSTDPKLVEFIAYCLNPNHYHFIIRQTQEKGIERFMHKIGMGYAKYFNTKYKRSGALFQGKFKAVHIKSNTQLLHVSAYVNLNNRVHRYPQTTHYISSWNEYLGKNKFENLCTKNVILDQFRNKLEYKKFAEESLKDIKIRKDLNHQLENEVSSLMLTPSVNK